MIAIADYGAGNIRSVANVMEKSGVDYVLTKKPSTLFKADGIILPGVGSFGPAMRALSLSGLKTALCEAANKGVPLLGICLGLQMLMDGSEEGGGEKGLGLIKGRVTKLKCGSKKLPHIGWTSLESYSGKLFKGENANQFYYFVHSYGAHPDDNKTLVNAACYGESFAAYVEKGNIFGCQFHPEKSGAAGYEIIRSFLELCGEEVNR